MAKRLILTAACQNLARTLAAPSANELFRGEHPLFLKALDAMAKKLDARHGEEMSPTGFLYFLVEEIRTYIYETPGGHGKLTPEEAADLFWTTLPTLLNGIRTDGAADQGFIDAVLERFDDYMEIRSTTK